MKNHYYCWLLFLAFCDDVLAQKTPDETSVIVSVSPLALADVFDGASFRLGGEARINERWAAAVEAGTYLRYLKSTKINPSGYLLRPSVKLYFNKKAQSQRFFALEYRYKNQHYDFRDSIVLEESRYEKQYSMQRKVHGLVFKYGYMRNLGRQFVLEWYCGLGIRHIRSFSNLSGEEQNGILSGEAGDCPIQEEFIRLTGTRIFPDFTAGIKLGFRLH